MWPLSLVLSWSSNQNVWDNMNKATKSTVKIQTSWRDQNLHLWFLWLFSWLERAGYAKNNPNIHISKTVGHVHSQVKHKGNFICSFCALVTLLFTTYHNADHQHIAMQIRCLYCIFTQVPYSLVLGVLGSVMFSTWKTLQLRSYWKRDENCWRKRRETVALEMDGRDCLAFRGTFLPV